MNGQGLVWIIGRVDFVTAAIFSHSLGWFAAEQRGFLHSTAQQATCLFAFFYQLDPFARIQISTFHGCLDPMLSFVLLAIRIGKFTHKVSLITPLCPGFGEIGSN